MDSRLLGQGSIDKMGIHPFAIESIPVAGMDRAIGVLDDNAVNREVEICRFSDSEVGAKSRSGHFFNLGKGKIGSRLVLYCDGALSQASHQF